MFGKHKPPAEPFTHAEDCRILAADPGAEIVWNEIRAGVWEAQCVCGKQYHHDPIADGRVKLDPFDPATSRHAPQCEYHGVADPAILKLVLRVQEGRSEGYWWTTCASCECSWQVPYFAEHAPAGRR